MKELTEIPGNSQTYMFIYFLTIHTNETSVSYRKWQNISIKLFSDTTVPLYLFSSLLFIVQDVIENLANLFSEMNVWWNKDQTIVNVIAN